MIKIVYYFLCHHRFSLDSIELLFLLLCFLWRLTGNLDFVSINFFFMFLSMLGCWRLVFSPFSWSRGFYSCCCSCRRGRGRRWSCDSNYWCRLWLWLWTRSFFMFLFFWNIFYFNFHWFFCLLTLYHILLFLLDCFSKICFLFSFLLCWSRGRSWSCHGCFRLILCRRRGFLDKFWWLCGLLWCLIRSRSILFCKAFSFFNCLFDRRFSRCCHCWLRFLCRSSWLFLLKFSCNWCLNWCRSRGCHCSFRFVFRRLFLFSNLLRFFFFLMFSILCFLCLSWLWFWLSSLFGSLPF